MKDQSHYHLNLSPPSLCCTETRRTEWWRAASGQWKAHLLHCTVQLSLAENEYVISLVNPKLNCFKSSLHYMHYVKQYWIRVGLLL